MIVIATNNGWDYLPTCVDSLRLHASGANAVIVDTGSSDEKYRAFAEKSAVDAGMRFLQVRPGESGYEHGALMKAYREFPDEQEFMFLQDSLKMKSDHTLRDFMDGLNYFDVVAWHYFSQGGSGWDGDEQRQWLQQNFGDDQYGIGIYGSVFAIKRDSLRLLEGEVAHIIVDNKMKSMGMERAWSILFRRHGMNVTYLEGYKGPIGSEAYIHFIKQTHRNGRYRS